MWQCDSNLRILLKKIDLEKRINEPFSPFYTFLAGPEAELVIISKNSPKYKKTKSPNILKLPRRTFLSLLSFSFQISILFFQRTFFTLLSFFIQTSILFFQSTFFALFVPKFHLLYSFISFTLFVPKFHFISSFLPLYPLYSEVPFYSFYALFQPFSFQSSI